MSRSDLTLDSCDGEVAVEARAFRLMLAGLLDLERSEWPALLGHLEAFAHLAPLAISVRDEVTQRPEAFVSALQLRRQGAEPPVPLLRYAESTHIDTAVVDAATAPFANSDDLAASGRALVDLCLRWDRSAADQPIEDHGLSAADHLRGLLLRPVHAVDPLVPVYRRALESMDSRQRIQLYSKNQGLARWLNPWLGRRRCWDTGTVCVVSGTPSSGRTTLATAMALGAIEAGIPVLWATSRSRQQHLIYRALTQWYGVDDPGDQSREIPGSWRSQWGSYLFSYADVTGDLTHLVDQVRVFCDESRDRVGSESPIPCMVVTDSLVVEGADTDAVTTSLAHVARDAGCIAVNTRLIASPTGNTFQSPDMHLHDLSRMDTGGRSREVADLSIVLARVALRSSRGGVIGGIVQHPDLPMESLTEDELIQRVVTFDTADSGHPVMYW